MKELNKAYKNNNDDTIDNCNTNGLSVFTYLKGPVL